MKTAGLFLSLSSLVVLAALSIMSGNAQAQEVRHAPDGGSRITIESIFIPPIPNAPFTATVVTEWTSRLADGKEVTIKNHRTVARDSAGRIFQERRAFAPNAEQTPTRLTQFEISDPSVGVQYICKPGEQVCVTRSYLRSQAVTSAATLASLPPKREASGGEANGEDLGHNTIEGLDSIGSRETTKIAAGVIGNDQPLSVIKEFWYSPQLGVNLVVNRIDPRSGTENFKVIDVNISEPDPKLFEPPSDYKVVDARESATR